MARPLRSKDSGLASLKSDSSAFHPSNHQDTAHVLCTHFLDSGGDNVLPIPGVVVGHSRIGIVRLCGYVADTAGSDVSYREHTEEHEIAELQASQIEHRHRTQFSNATSNQLPPIAKRIAANPKTLENRYFVAFWIVPEPEKRFARREAARA